MGAGDDYGWPQAEQQKPIDMVLHCPACGMQHIDREQTANECNNAIGWSNPPHRSHLCHGCGHIWRPADVPTNGVQSVKTQGKDDSPTCIGCWSLDGLILHLAHKFTEANDRGDELDGLDDVNLSQEERDTISAQHESADNDYNYFKATLFMAVRRAAGQRAIAGRPAPALLDVMRERSRQITDERYIPSHDDEHCDGSMARAAACYALDSVGFFAAAQAHWPWELAAWKPKDARRNLIRAGALILAEIERLDRAAAALEEQRS